MYRKKTVAIICILCVCLLSVVAIQPLLTPQSERLPNPKFIFSSWSFPDEYGQGIEGFEVFENSSGAWVQVGGYKIYDEEQSYEWNTSVAIKLICWTWFNSTLTGAVSGADGKNYQQHSVNVAQINGTSVFSQQNFTYVYVDVGIEPPLWFYGYSVVLDFLPSMGEIYTVTVTYEVWW